MQVGEIAALPLPAQGAFVRPSDLFAICSLYETNASFDPLFAHKFYLWFAASTIIFFGMLELFCEAFFNLPTRSSDRPFL